MAAFAELDWRRFDVCGVVEDGGLATIEVGRHLACRGWLEREGYRLDTLDFSGGIGPAVTEFGRLMCWEGQFGYTLGPDNPNLDAINDGFDFGEFVGTGRVLELLRPDTAYREDARWLRGFLSIAQRHSRSHLAQGRRFFTLLVVPDGSRLIGKPLEPVVVPGPWWSPCEAAHRFEV